MIEEFTNLTLTETTPDELLQLAKQALQTYFLGTSHINVIGTVSSSLENSDQASDVTSFVKRLITALEKDHQEKTVFSTLFTSLRRFLPSGSTTTSTISPLIASIAAYFRESDPARQLETLKTISETLSKVKCDELGKECRKECMRLIMNPLNSIQHLDAAGLLETVYVAHFSIEQPETMLQLVFHDAAWKQAPRLFIEFLEKRLSTTHLYYDQYFTCIEDALKHYAPKLVDADTFSSFLQTQLSLDQDPQVVHVLVALLRQKGAPHLITCYKNLLEYMPEHPIRALRLACFLQKTDLLSNVYYSYQTYKLPKSVIIDNDNQVVLVSEETEQLRVYHRTTTAIRLHLTPSHRCYSVSETTYESVGTLQVPSQIVDVAKMVKGRDGILEMIATCQYKRTEASPVRLSIFWQTYDKPLTRFIGCSQKEQIAFTLNLARGLFSLHSLKVLHGSISLQTAVVKEGKALWQLQDTACMASQAKEPYKNLDTSAPELAESSAEPKDALKAELWAFGVAIFELTGRELPWKQQRSSAIKSLYETHTNGILSHKNPYLTWVWALLNPDPDKRPNLSESITLLEKLLS